ncbi:efflux RND transporter periplasmic adaptor subunit [Phyllobacterium phragmitis]|uniref:Efflux RND transporter periplasmic adaptor subunit n=1 Tax=Phyllobacterium phragmitis TaxID=2670329 RepID=A0A2S9IPS0_9HYPH|nr:efflux RND transporter periplasmic adaptor subunit [Phyllobacterium phragmitis]PRD42528.1 efflux RND transporter periplasmic adaptor subunit [Phyllobacterium phragmitis]
MAGTKRREGGTRGHPAAVGWRRFAGIGILAIAVSACHRHDDIAKGEDSVAVAVERVKYSEFAPGLSLTGAIAARTLANFSFRVGGQIIEREADVGQHVMPQDVLARIDPVEQQVNIRTAQASVDAANSQVVQASSAFDRQKTLLAQGFTTRRQYDAAQEVLRTAQSALTVAKSQLANARDQLSFTELRANISGIVTARNIEVGQVVQATETVFTIAEDGPRDAVFDVQETLVADTKTDPVVTVTLLSNPLIKAQGRVREVSPAIDPATGTVRVKVSIADTPPQMTLGATVTGSMRMKPQRAAILPWSVLTSNGGQPAVWVIAGDANVATLAPVKILSYERERVVIESGLEEGQRVVTRGTQLLRAGEVVDIVEETGQ